MPELPSAICIHDDSLFLSYVISAFQPVGEVFVFVSRLPWSGEAGNWEETIRIADECGATVVTGDWADESTHRKFALEYLKSKDMTHVLIPDSDEIPEPELLENLLKIAEVGLADKVRVRMATYWKSTEHVVVPPEELAPVLLLNVQNCEHRYIREFDGGSEIVLGREHGLLHHLSYVGPDSRIEKKIKGWSHKHEVLDAWWNEKWLGWDKDPCTQNLHPTHPIAFRQIERRGVPEVLAGVDSGREIAQPPHPIKNWPSISIVIPLYGGEEDIRDCLESLKTSFDLLSEIFVVDDLSPDNSAQIAEEMGIAHVLRRDTNGGFAAACNDGLAAAKGDVTVFLNSDTIVPRSGLISLINGLMEDARMGMVGPVSNAVAYFQQVNAPVSDAKAIDGFATDLSWSKKPSEAVSMLVGFCIALPTELARQIGGFSPEFGAGMYEDNELCFRVQELGYELHLIHSAFVYHKGSKSIRRAIANPKRLMDSNAKVFEGLRRGQVLSGYASHLPGERRDPIRFNPARHPDALRQSLREKAKEAQISLCMIVRDEVRVIRDCLRSTEDIFTERIIVDTGSKDGTLAILQNEFDVTVREMEWPQSFALARNKSIEGASGKWIFWMDADDVLPSWSAERILDAAITAPEWVVGFVIPVQFVEDEMGNGTRVDHVKLFRNLPGLEFEGRIHEQILGSLRRTGGEIQRLEAVVLHSGYDTSETGQAKKRKRDDTLLKLDLADRPGHPFVLFNLGMTAHYNDDHERAIDWFNECLSVSKVEESHVRKVYALLTNSFRALRDNIVALKVVNDGLLQFPDDPELKFVRGVILMEQREFGEARIDLESIPEETPNHFASFDTSIQGYKKFLNLSICCAEMGDHVGEEHYLRKASGLAPGSISVGVALFESGLRRRSYALCEEALMSLLLHSREREKWGEMVTHLALVQGVDPSQKFAQFQRMYPHDEGVGLAWARYLLEEGRLQEATPILSALQSSGNAHSFFLAGVAYANAGYEAEALSLWRETLRIDENHVGAKQNLEILEKVEHSERISGL